MNNRKGKAVAPTTAQVKLTQTSYGLPVDWSRESDFLLADLLLALCSDALSRQSQKTILLTVEHLIHLKADQGVNRGGHDCVK